LIGSRQVVELAAQSHQNNWEVSVDASLLGYLIRDRALLAPRFVRALAGFVASRSIDDSLASDNVINRSISHPPAGPGWVGLMYRLQKVFSPTPVSKSDACSSRTKSNPTRLSGLLLSQHEYANSQESSNPLCARNIVSETSLG
jgi:hypothetical protein